MNYNEERQKVKETIAKFPERFGLRAYPNQIFRISEQASYVNDRDEVILYTQIKRNEEWLDFAKGSVLEIYNNHVLLKGI